MASLGTWPAAFKPISFRLVHRTNQRLSSSPGEGSEFAVDMLRDRWMAYMTLPQANHATAQAIEALVARFRGQVNWIDLWHMARPVPLGTITGSPTVSGAHAQGASSLVIAGAGASRTVLAGDLVAAGGLLLMAATDATANGSGVVTVPLVNRLRTALSAGAAVTINQPKASFRLLRHSGVGYLGGLISDEVTLEFGEKI